MGATTIPPVPSGDWPAEDLERVMACPVCDGEPGGVLHDGLTDRVFRAAPGRWRLMRCGACRSGFLDPRPTESSIGRAYSRYYTHGAEGLPDASPARPSGLRGALIDAHLRARWGYPLSSRLAALGPVIGRLVPLRAATADREVRHLPARPGGRLLDLGSGSGSVVAQLRALGWEAEGLDPDPAAVALAEEAGIPVRQGTLDDLGAGERFAAVTLSHVIEHVHDPRAVLERIRLLLEPDGLLWIATPNLEALGHRRFGRDWVSLDPPRHLSLFTPSSLHALLVRTGFEPQPAPAPSPTAWQTFSQSAAIRDGRSHEQGPAHGGRRLSALAALADRIALRRPELAEELVIVAKPPA